MLAFVFLPSDRTSTKEILSRLSVPRWLQGLWSKTKPAASPRRVCRSGVVLLRVELGQAQLAPNRTSQTNQTSSKQAQRARLRNGKAGIAALKTDAAIEEAFARIHGELRRGSDLSICTHQCATQRVVVGAVSKRNIGPTLRALKVPLKITPLGTPLVPLPVITKLPPAASVPPC